MSEARHNDEVPTPRPVDDETEIVIALVAAVGTDLEMVTEELQTELNEYGYSSSVTRLSAYLYESARLDAPPHLDEYLSQAMNLGNSLRDIWERNDALALYAVSDIVAEREQRSGGNRLPGQDAPPTMSRHAFVLRSVKTRGELRTLRAIYGPRLYVLGAYSSYQARVESLSDRIGASRSSKNQSEWAHSPEALIARDQKEEDKDGQDVSGTFHRADFFVAADTREATRHDLGRVLRILFGDPYTSPTREEHAQFLAAGAALRSVELGRQVGAALVTVEGDALAVGANEVPKGGGGAHWTGDPDDNRDFAVNGHDTNRRHLDDLREQLADAVLKTCSDALADVEGIEGLLETLKASVPNAIRDAGLKDLTEFGRAVHAEMSVLLEAARRGISVRGATLHTTTFPCHNCARHIVAAGIGRVVFVEPYAKSRALELHGDAITSEAQSTSPGVSLEPFVGVAPRRYLKLFSASWREANESSPRKWCRSSALRSSVATSVAHAAMSSGTSSSSILGSGDEELAGVA